MDLLYYVYIAGFAVWVSGVLALRKASSDPFKTLIAGLLGIVWPVAALITLLYIYYERN